MLSVKSYTCKYIDPNKHVYAIVSPAKSSRSSKILTTPFHSNTGDTYNAIVAFECKTYASWWYNNVQQQCEASPIRDKLTDIVYIASQLKMPVVVILSSSCDIDTKTVSHDIFYKASELS